MTHGSLENFKVSENGGLLPPSPQPSPGPPLVSLYAYYELFCLTNTKLTNYDEIYFSLMP